MSGLRDSNLGLSPGDLAVRDPAERAFGLGFDGAHGDLLPAGSSLRAESAPARRPLMRLSGAALPPRNSPCRRRPGGLGRLPLRRAVVRRRNPAIFNAVSPPAGRNQNVVRPFADQTPPSGHVRNEDDLLAAPAS